jgi:hypothetical protein
MASTRLASSAANPAALTDPGVLLVRSYFFLHTTAQVTISATTAASNTMIAMTTQPRSDPGYSAGIVAETSATSAP